MLRSGTRKFRDWSNFHSNKMCSCVRCCSVSMRWIAKTINWISLETREEWICDKRVHSPLTLELYSNRPCKICKFYQDKKTAVVRTCPPEVWSQRRKFYYRKQRLCTQRNIEARSRNYCCHEKAVRIKYSECVSVVLFIHHIMRMRCIKLSTVACLSPSLSLSLFFIFNFFFYIFTTWLQRIKLYYSTMCLLTDNYKSKLIWFFWYWRPIRMLLAPLYDTTKFLSYFYFWTDFESKR